MRSSERTVMEPGSSNRSTRRLHNLNSVTKKVEFDDQPKSCSKGASFIKLLGSDFRKQLQIPHEFTMIFNGYIPHRFIIESAMTKKCWRVEVEEERDGAIYFREGWTDFVEAHPLEVGNFLLFEYEEQSIFLVKIYNRNGCQKSIEDARGGKHNPVKVVDFEEQEESEALVCEPKKLKTSRAYQQKPRRLPIRKYGNGMIYKKKHAVQGKYTRTAKVSWTGNNMAFSVTIHKSKMHQFKQLTIPKSISLAKKLTTKDEVILQDAMGNRWPVTLAHRTDGRAILTYGWKAFVKDNEVSAGDLLSFEFVSDNLVNVHVKRASQVEQKTDEAKSPNGATTAPNMSCELDTLDACTADVTPGEASITTRKSGKGGRPPESPSSSFSFLWRPTTVGTYLHVPKYVIDGQNLKDKDSVVLRDPEGKCWPLEVSTRRDGRVALTKGWVDFWKGHAIIAGDSLDFEFVSDFLIQVKINRGKQQKSHSENEEAIVNYLSITDDDEPGADPDIVITPAKAVITQAETVASVPTAIDFN